MRSTQTAHPGLCLPSIAANVLDDLQRPLCVLKGWTGSHQLVDEQLLHVRPARREHHAQDVLRVVIYRGRRSTGPYLRCSSSLVDHLKSETQARLLQWTHNIS